MKDYKGFTLIEVIVILAVISILAAMAIPTALRIFQTTAENTTREEMDNIKKAILGDPRKLQSSFRSEFGFIGDIGCLPDDLRRIFRNDAPPLPSSLPAYSFDSAKQTGRGWNGPYITGTAGEDFTKDQWGNDYTYTSSGCTTPFTATLTSNGPDGQTGGGDDISTTVVANETTATVRGTVKDGLGNRMASISVELYAPVNGVLTTFTTTPTDSNGDYSFSSVVPFGYRAVRVKPTLAFLPGSVLVSGGSNNNVSFQVKNVSDGAVTVTSIKVTCTSPVVQVADITFDGTNVENPNSDNRPCSAASAAFALSGANTSFTAGTTLQAPLRIVADESDTRVPDLIIDPNAGNGAVRTIALNDFEDSGGNNIDMRSRVLTVTFFSGATTLLTTTFTTPA